MSVTYDLTNDVGKVRLIIQDGASSDSSIKDAAIFQDADVQGFLDLEGSIKLAAAQALDAMASSESMVMKRITLLALKTDGPATAADLRKHAQMLRDQYLAGQSDDAAGLFDWAEQVLSPWSEKEIILNEAQRKG